jgi:acylphosphatase
VRNRRDGTVEAVFSGSPDLVEAMLAACRKGPASARVSDVEILPETDGPGPESSPDRFQVLATV